MKIVADSTKQEPKPVEVGRPLKTAKKKSPRIKRPGRAAKRAKIDKEPLVYYATLAIGPIFKYEPFEEMGLQQTTWVRDICDVDSSGAVKLGTANIKKLWEFVEGTSLAELVNKADHTLVYLDEEDDFLIETDADLSQALQSMALDREDLCYDWVLTFDPVSAEDIMVTRKAFANI